MATRDPKAKSIPLDELIERLTALKNATGVERARLARELSATSGPTIVSIKAAGDEGLWQATRPRGELTYDEAAAALGYGSQQRVSDAVSSHLRRRRGEI